MGNNGVNYMGESRMYIIDIVVYSIKKNIDIVILTNKLKKEKIWLDAQISFFFEGRLDAQMFLRVM